MGVLSPYMGTADSRRCPRLGGGIYSKFVDHRSQMRKEKRMRMAKRIAIALGSLAAIMLAGGAHYRL